MIDEAMQSALDYCQEDLTPEETVRRGAVIVQAIHGRLGEINESEGMTTYILGGVLKKLKTNDIWKMVAGAEYFESWGDFCKKKTGKSLGSCYAMIRIWEKSQKVGMSPQEIEKIGWGTADLILRQSKNRADVDRLVQVYNETGSREKFLEEIKHEPSVRKIRKKRYVRLTEDEETFYGTSLELAAERAGRELHKNMSEEEALLFALVQWREGTN